MKKFSSSSNSRCDSPKTPGGISKSLLTPIRRLGLSRNWKKSGPTPFVSPLSCDDSPKTEIVIEKNKHTSKERAKPTQDNIKEEHTSSTIENDTLGECDLADLESTTVSKTPNIVTTPFRAVRISYMNKSKMLKHALNSIEGKADKEKVEDKGEEDRKLIDFDKKQCKQKPLSNKSSGKSSPKRSPKTEKSAYISYDTQEVVIECNTVTKQEVSKSNKVNALERTPKNNNSISTAKENGPNNLTKECIVLIQKKINKNALLKEKILPSIEQKPTMLEQNKINPAVSQDLFDSDSDDAPLSKITNKKSHEKLTIESKKRPRLLSTENDDFSENTRVSAKIKKLEDKNTSTGDLKSKSNKILRSCKKPTVIMQPVIHITSSQSSNSFNDDDDFEFDRKKTILIRKTYDKVTKLQKAKSTGSVTQKDVEELKARIKIKKNMLLAKTMSNDTDELRGLIKKWKKGCQDALTELMDLMKAKFPEKQYMDYSEILQTLKIPPGLVGYDSDNDCFVSPDDAGIILSKFKI